MVNLDKLEEQEDYNLVEEEEQEDYNLAAEISNRIAQGKEKTYSIEEVRVELGLDD